MKQISVGCQCCVGKCLPSAGTIGLLFFRMPFTYNFIKLTAIYGIALFNIMFHLLAATTVENEHWSTTALKFFIFFCVGFNFLPVLFQMVATANDSWNDFPYLSLRSARLLQTVEAFVDGHYYHARRLSSSSVKQTRSTVKKKGSDGGGTKDMELFNIIHQSTS